MRFSTPLAVPSDSAPSPNGAVPLQDVHTRLSRVAHDLNNPLAIIAGNAQFVRELAHSLDVAPDVLQAILDIEEASHRLHGVVSELVRLKEAVGESVEVVEAVGPRQEAAS
ncbi:MAG: histidine kinase dimerization/phospho-acceptor domain-containing protein [Rhodothermales bacterium]|nr:histidine kinase dimerization/phospho-acceptor domain-containing protein [Rhodothermales bacterium]